MAYVETIQHTVRSRMSQ